MLKVAVLMGGPSEEHAISLKSGEGVVAALSHKQFSVEPLVIPKALSVFAASGFAHTALKRLNPDVVFIALHGAFGEDGTIQAECENLRLAYTGSNAQASRLGMDKIASRKCFEQAGLAVPKGQTVDLKTDHIRPETLAYPVVVKPVHQGSSIGVSIVHKPEQLAAALSEVERYESQALIEEFIPGREVTVAIFAEEPLPVVEIRPQQPFFDYAAKYTKGLTEYDVPARLEPDIAKAIQAAGLAAHRALGCRHLSRSDFILDGKQVPVILEVNTVPGFTPTSLVPKAAACVSLSYDELCEQLVLMALQDIAQISPAR